VNPRVRQRVPLCFRLAEIAGPLRAVGFDELKCPTSSPCMPLGPWGMFINPRVPKDQQNAAWKLMQYLDSTPFLTQEIKVLDFPGLAVTKTVASEHFAGVPDSFLQAEAYAESVTTGPIDGSFPTVMRTLPPPMDSPIVATRLCG